MPAQDPFVTFRVVPNQHEDPGHDPLDEEYGYWGPPEVTIYYTQPATARRPHPYEYDWLCLGDEVIRRLYVALGGYLAKKAHDARA